MRLLLPTMLCLSVLYSCQSSVNEAQDKAQLISTEDYEIILPKEKLKGLLILFGGFPETPTDIRREFQIEAPSLAKGIGLLYMRFNQRLWLEQEEKEQLAQVLEEAFQSHDIRTAKIYLGGFSSGGNIALLLTNHLLKTTSSVQPEGVFVVDAPVDLLQLYECSQRNIESAFSDISVQESQMIVGTFDQNFGLPKDGIDRYELASPFTLYTKNLQNLNALGDSKVRLYTEPDTLWWKENRMNDYIDMNAYYLKKLSEALKAQLKHTNVQLIETQDRGFRA
ncbi:MAG: hypothetical protein AAF242_04955, partial [Bacteroidota bacterium]